MRKDLMILAALVLPAAADPSQAAEAVSYTGMLGKSRIIAEFIGTEDGKSGFGRYAYLSKGIDIPLHLRVGKAALAIEEEAPCSQKTCQNKEGERVETYPVGARWTLSGNIGDDRLQGNWTAQKGGKPLSIDLKKLGARDGSPIVELDQFSFSLPAKGSEEDPAISGWSAEMAPYEAAKMDYPFTEGKEVSLGTGRYRLDEDKRVEMPYPVVTSLGGADPTRLNTLLHRLRSQTEDPAFNCLSQTYLGFGWWSNTPDIPSNGFDGNYSVRVDHLSDRLMSISEGGSFYCGGAHPNNFSSYSMLDPKLGELVLPKDLLKGWVARDFDGNVVDPAADGVKADTLRYGPSDELIDYVEKNREKQDAQTETECGMSDLVKSNLSVYVKDDDLVFTLTDLPHVIFACEDDVLSVPLKDARPLLTEKGARYFAVLD